MMPCEAFRDALSASLDDALAPGEAAALEAHLAQCPACRQALEDLRGTVARVRSLEPVEPPPGFAERILARTSPPRRRPLPLASHPQLRAAALVLVCLTGLLVMKVAGPRRVSAPPALAVPAPTPGPPASPGTLQPPPAPASPAPPRAHPRELPTDRPDLPPATAWEAPPARDAAPSEAAAPARTLQMMKKAAEPTRQEAREEALYRPDGGERVNLRLVPQAPGDPATAVAAALAKVGATGVQVEGRSAKARLESRRLPALVTALGRTFRVQDLPPADLPPEIQVNLSW